MHLRDYIEHLRSKPEHIRRRIALGTSFGFTALVAVLWFTSLAASGTFTLASNTVPENKDLPPVLPDTSKSVSELLGAVGAYQSAAKNPEAPITIVDGSASSTLEARGASEQEKTVIPF